MLPIIPAIVAVSSSRRFPKLSSRENKSFTFLTDKFYWCVNISQGVFCRINGRIDNDMIPILLSSSIIKIQKVQCL